MKTAKNTPAKKEEIRLLFSLSRDLHKEAKISAIREDSKFYDYIRKCIRIGHEELKKIS